MTATALSRTATPAKPPAAPQEPAGLDAGALLAKAIEAQLPVDSMQRLLDMRAQLRAEQAAGAFAAALAEFQRDLPPIEKRQTARIQSQRGHFSYRYADLADIQRAIGPRLAACGLAVTFDTEEDGDRLDVICRVHHTAGHSSEARFPVPVDRSARMNAAQQVGAALTYGRRYALTAALGIVTADEDTDAAGFDSRGAHSAAAPNGSAAGQRFAPAASPAGTPPPASEVPPTSAGASGDKGASPITPAQKRRLGARITELGLQDYRERIKAWTAKQWQIESLSALSRDQYKVLIDKLDDFAERIAIETEAAARDAATIHQQMPV